MEKQDRPIVRLTLDCEHPDGNTMNETLEGRSVLVILDQGKTTKQIIFGTLNPLNILFSLEKAKQHLMKAWKESPNAANAPDFDKALQDVLSSLEAAP